MLIFTFRSAVLQLAEHVLRWGTNISVGAFTCTVLVVFFLFLNSVNLLYTCTFQLSKKMF